MPLKKKPKTTWENKYSSEVVSSKGKPRFEPDLGG